MSDLESQVARRLERRYQDKFEQLRKNFAERLQQIADTLATATVRMSNDATLAALKNDDASSSFAQMRAVEILVEEISMERESTVATLLQTAAERTGERDMWKQQCQEAQQALAGKDAETRRAVLALAAADSRVRALEENLDVSRAQYDQAQSELASLRVASHTVAQRDRARVDADATLHRQVQQAEQAKDGLERLVSDLRTANEARTREAAEAQQAVATIHAQANQWKRYASGLTFLRWSSSSSHRFFSRPECIPVDRDSEGMGERLAAQDTQVPQLQRALAARDKRVVALEEQRNQLAVCFLFVHSFG